MTLALWVIVAMTMLAIAGYAQYRIPVHTAQSRVALTRAVLAVVAAAFGYAVAANLPGPRQLALPIFLAAFGVVHLPAALILFFKDLQGAGKS